MTGLRVINGHLLDQAGGALGVFGCAFGLFFGSLPLLFLLFSSASQGLFLTFSSTTELTVPFSASGHG
jgi:hypothetical protein